jgi:hypothetical protein
MLGQKQEGVVRITVSKPSLEACDMDTEDVRRWVKLSPPIFFKIKIMLF